MSYDGVYDRFADAASDEHPDQELVDSIDRIQSKLSKKYWSSSGIHSAFESFYGELNSRQQNEISSEQKTLKELYVSEKDDRRTLKQKFKNVAPPASGEVIENQSDRLLRRIVAADHSTKRQSVKKEVSVALDHLRDDLKTKSFDLRSAKIAIANGNTDRLSRQLNEYSSEMKNRGWQVEDIKTLIKSAKENNRKPVVFLDELEERDKISFDFLVFLPMIDVATDYISSRSNFEIHPSDHFEMGDLPNSGLISDVDSFEDWAQERLEEDASIEFHIEAWEFNEAKTKAIDVVSRFLDSCANVDQRARLEEPQYEAMFWYIYWRSDQQIPPHLSMFQEPKPSARFSEEEMEHVDELYSMGQSDTPLSNRLTRAIHYFRKGNIAYREVDTTIYYIACLEALTTDSTSVTDEIYSTALRFGNVWPSAEERIVDRLERLYDARNAALHAGLSNAIDDSDISIIQSILSEIIWNMIRFAKRGGSTLSDFDEFVKTDRRAKYRYVANKIVDHGLKFNQQYTTQGEAIDEAGTVKFRFPTQLEFVDEGDRIRISVECSNIQRVESGIHSNQMIDLRLNEVSGTSIKMGSMTGGRFMMRDSASFTFGDFEVI